MIIARSSQQTTNLEHTLHNTAYKQHGAHETDANNAQPARHGVIKRTIGGSLARSWPPPPLRRRRCCVLLATTAVGPACCCEYSFCCCCFCCVRVLILSFTLCVCTPRALAHVNAQPPRHGVIKRAIGGSLARSWPSPLPRRCRCCGLLLLLLGLSAASTNNGCAVVACAACEC